MTTNGTDDTTAVVPITPEPEIGLGAIEIAAQGYQGASLLQVTIEQAAVLARPCLDNELDILPTGEVYLSQVGYRRRLNEAFSPGGWALIPRSQVRIIDGETLGQLWALVIRGHYVSEAWGESDYNPRNQRMSYLSTIEAVKSNALMRCCKDLGIAAECWDRKWANTWRKKQCLKVYRTGDKIRREQDRWQWRLKAADPWWDEGKPAKKGERPEPPSAADIEARARAAGAAPGAPQAAPGATRPTGPAPGTSRPPAARQAAPAARAAAAPATASRTAPGGPSEPPGATIAPPAGPDASAPPEVPWPEEVTQCGEAGEGEVLDGVVGVATEVFPGAEVVAPPRVMQLSSGMLTMIGVLRSKHPKFVGEQAFIDLLGRLGYEHLEDVPPGEVNQLLAALREGR